MPEANTMEPVKTELVDSFIKYITGVYLLQQEFIDDMQGGLQSVLEKYNVSVVGSETASNTLPDAPGEVQNYDAVAPKKPRKKSTKKEKEAALVKAAVVEEAEAEAEVVAEEAEVEEEEAVVEEAEAEEEAVIEEAEAVVQEEEVSIPSHVESALNDEVVEKKKRKPRAKKGEVAVARASEEPKKKRPITAYRVFVTEFSKTDVCKGLSMADKGPLMSAEWAIIKDDPEKLKVYEEKAVEINRENGL